MNNKIPIIYSYIYYRLKKDRKIFYIEKKKLKEVIARILVRKGGLPKILIKYIIKDLVNLNLLEEINNHSYKINDSNCDKEIRKLFYIV